jgi:Xaa-Pro aminopeptidase
VTVRGNILHCHHSGDVMAEGDLLLADVGAETPEGWAADVTRTWPVSGRFSSTQREAYEAVFLAQQAARNEKPKILTSRFIQKKVVQNRFLFQTLQIH